MKKILTILLTMLCIVSLEACTKKENTEETTTNKDSDNETIANPWTYVDTLEEASKLAGFDLTVPEDINYEEITSIGYWEDGEEKLIEVQYGDGNSAIRKAITDEEGDITGVYEEYSHGGMVEGTSVSYYTFEGSDEHIVNKVYWTDGDYKLSLYSKDGFSEDNLLVYVENIK